MNLLENRFNFPSSSTIEFINDGNVHLTPRGYLRIYDKKTVYYENRVEHTITGHIAPATLCSGATN